MILELEDTNENRLLLVILELQNVIFTVERAIIKGNRRLSLIQNNAYYRSQAKQVLLHVHIDKHHLGRLGIQNTIKDLFNITIESY